MSNEREAQMVDVRIFKGKICGICKNPTKSGKLLGLDQLCYTFGLKNLALIFNQIASKNETSLDSRSHWFFRVRYM